MHYTRIYVYKHQNFTLISHNYCSRSVIALYYNITNDIFYRFLKAT